MEYSRHCKFLICAPAFDPGDLPSEARYWQFEPGAAWHGYRHVTPGHAMTDPNKLTVLTPASTVEPAPTVSMAFPHRCPIHTGR